jgi:hypothetical protein
LLPDRDLIDIGGADASVHAKGILRGHDRHDVLAGSDHAANGVHRQIMYKSGLRRAQIDALQLIFGGNLALQQFGNARLELAQFLAGIRLHILVSLIWPCERAI